jgi:hypothetical protein
MQTLTCENNRIENKQPPIPSMIHQSPLLSSRFPRETSMNWTQTREIEYPSVSSEIRVEGRDQSIGRFGAEWRENQAHVTYYLVLVCYIS